MWQEVDHGLLDLTGERQSSPTLMILTASNIKPQCPVSETAVTAGGIGLSKDPLGVELKEDLN